MKTSKSMRDGAQGDGLNESRVQWADSALQVFQQETGADLQDAVSDLLGDLMHWCDHQGQDFENELRRARFHYEVETGK